MQDFLHNIFSRGSVARTDSPIVSVGGVSSNSGTLTYDVLHFDTAGALIVSGGGSGTATSNVVASQSGSWTVAVSQGTITALTIWTQRLDASNDAILSYGSVRTSDIAGLMAASGSNIPMITDSLGKQVVLPGAVNDLHLNGQAFVAQVAAVSLIATPGAGKRIAVQSILVTASASQIVQVIITGGPSSRTFGYASPTGGFALNAGGAPLYITSASTNLSVQGDVTASFNVFASGYSMSN